MSVSESVSVSVSESVSVSVSESESVSESLLPRRSCAAMYDFENSVRWQTPQLCT